MPSLCLVTNHAFESVGPDTDMDTLLSLGYCLPGNAICVKTLDLN